MVLIKSTRLAFQDKESKPASHLSLHCLPLLLDLKKRPRDVEMLRPQIIASRNSMRKRQQSQTSAISAIPTHYIQIIHGYSKLNYSLPGIYPSPAWKAWKTPSLYVSFLHGCNAANPFLVTSQKPSGRCHDPPGRTSLGTGPLQPHFQTVSEPRHRSNIRSSQVASRRGRHVPCCRKQSKNMAAHVEICSQD